MQKKYNKKVNDFLNNTKSTIYRIKEKNFKRGDFFFLILPWLLLASLLIVFPLILLFFYSFFDITSSSFISLTINNYGDFFSSFNMMQVLLTSLFVGSFTTISSLIFGYPIAYYLSNLENKHKKSTLLILVTMPIWINMLIRVLATQVIVQWIAPQIIGTYFGVILGMTYTFIPFMILPIYNSLNKRDRDLEKASKDLGASGVYTFWKITFPNSLSSIYSGSIMVLLPSMTSITVTRYMSGGSINNIGNILENLFVNSTNYTYGAAVAIITLIFMSLIIIILRVFTKQRSARKKERINE